MKKNETFIVSIPPPEACVGQLNILDPEHKLMGTWTPCPEYNLRTIAPHSHQVMEHDLV